VGRAGANTVYELGILNGVKEDIERLTRETLAGGVEKIVLFEGELDDRYSYGKGVLIRNGYKF
jgi:hypothetical protein